MISFDRTLCNDFDKAIEKEWLETNGLGGYASSTIVGANTRGYHGLLVAATRPPLGRMLLLSRLEETLVVDGKRYEISCNQYPGAIYPEGYKYLDSFRLDPFPIFTYVLEGVKLEKSVFMVHGKNTTFIAYRLTESPGEVTLELRPLIACRDFHGRMHEGQDFSMGVQPGTGSMFITPHNRTGASSLFLSARRGAFHESSCWYRSFEYREEEKRGYESHEDLYSPGYFDFKLKQGEEIALTASTDDPSRLDLETMRPRELERRMNLTKATPVLPELKAEYLDALMMAADQFIVKRGEYDLFSIIAGYHWFGDWGRDAMIALPGLTLVTKRYDIARGILKAYASYCDQGMIPNRFPETGEAPEYNAVDTSLWFIHAVKKFFDYTADLSFIREELFHVLARIVRSYTRGTRHNIHMDRDGLIYAGEPGMQLTWMDAKVGDAVVTPRSGKAVEINALWYNALKVMEELSRRLGRTAPSVEYSLLAEKAKQSYNRVFWNEAGGCLYDCVDEDSYDASVRPNQIFALSLPYQLLTADRANAVLKTVQQELFTPFGLRSLSPRHEGYKGRYGGDQYSRDTAYHQGTVWAWLLGPFITAYVNVNGRNEESRDFAKNLLSNFLSNHLSDAGLGTISEIFDGDPPYRPQGCIAQAWSVAEILRAYAEDVTGEKRRLI